MKPRDQIHLPIKFKNTIISHAIKELPNECCGLLLGKKGEIKRIIPMKSEPPAPDAYYMDPQQQEEVFTEMEKRGESLLGIYHSHPNGPAGPSGADLQLAFHPNAVYVIVSLADRQVPEVRGFVLTEGCFEEVGI